MASVHITLRGLKYSISCSAGEESRIIDLAAYVQKKIDELGVIPMAISEAQLLAITCILLADEACDRAAELANSKSALASDTKISDVELEEVSRSYSAAIARIEQLIAKL